MESFIKYSQFKVWAVNIACGFPKCLYDYRFAITLFHYSAWGGALYPIFKPFDDYLATQIDNLTIQFCQDENYNCRRRRAFITDYNIQWIYTSLDPQYYQEVYYSRCPTVKKIFPTLCGYVSDNMLAKARKFAKPFEKRTIDIGYRARTLPPYLGRGAMEKQLMGLGFLERAKGLGLNLDIKINEESRLYGDDWYKWLGNCRAVLGVEGGGSIFDLDDEVWDTYRRKPCSYEELPVDLMKKMEGRIFYQHFTPRHLEAAACHTPQILFTGKYNGNMKPWVHYAPLEKDFSNFHEVMSRVPLVAKTISDNTYNDLIVSGKYTYQKFIQGFDQNLLDAGLTPSINQNLAREVTQALRAYINNKRLNYILQSKLYIPFCKSPLGKAGINGLYHPAREIYRAIRRTR